MFASATCATKLLEATHEAHHRWTIYVGLTLDGHAARVTAEIADRDDVP